MIQTQEQPKVEGELTQEQKISAVKELIDDYTAQIDMLATSGNAAEAKKMEYALAGAKAELNALESGEEVVDKTESTENKQTPEKSGEKLPDVVTAEYILAKNPLEKGIMVQAERAAKEKEKVEAKIKEIEEALNNTKNDEEKVGLKTILLLQQRILGNLTQGLEKEAERKANVEEKLAA